VARNAVRRRLRGVVVGQRSSLPSGTDLVVRALPAAAATGFDGLTTDFSEALSRVSAQMGAGGGSR
jgi:ribonuclease P protein component